MPGPKTHQIFYKQLKNSLGKATLETLPQYDAYSIFAQGHDLLIYHDFYKIHNQAQLERNIKLSKELQENLFSEFVFLYLKSAEEMGVMNNEQVQLFIGPGYIGHHILDAYTHPLIIYYAGDHVRDSHNETWRHGIAENLIDLYLMKHIEKIDYQKCTVYKEFEFQGMSEELKEVLDKSLEAVYGIANGGELFEKACTQVRQYMWLLKYDPTGVKRLLFDYMDSRLKGTASFSYNRSEEGAEEFLNNSHKIWRNPMDGSMRSQSFMELYQKALCDCGKIIERLEELCKKGNIAREDVQAIVPDIASTHGLSCGKTIEIKYTKEICGDVGEQSEL